MRPATPNNYLIANDSRTQQPTEKQRTAAQGRGEDSSIVAAQAKASLRVRQKEIVPNQILDFDQFLSEVDMVVIMVKHDHIRQNWDKLKGKVILDCHNICPLTENVYHI